MTFRVLYPSRGNILGGSHISTLTLAENLPKDYEPVLAVAEEGPVLDRYQKNGYSYLRFSYKGEFYKSTNFLTEIIFALKNAFHLKKFIRAYQIDLVHTNEYDMHNLWVFASFLAGVPHIWHQRSLNNSRRLLIYAPFVSAYLTISKFCKDHLPSFIGFRTQIIPNPVQISVSNDINQKDYKEEKTIGFVGHLDDQKRVMTFLKIANQITKSYPHPELLSFIIIGSLNGPCAQQAQTYAKDHVQSSVTFTDHVTDVLSWIKSLDVLIAPAQNEGLGRAVIEAQMLGVLVIASDSGGHRELIEDDQTGFLCPLDDVKAFSEKACKVLSAPHDFENIRIRAHEVSVEKYSVAHHVSAIKKIYDRLLLRRSK